MSSTVLAAFADAKREGAGWAAKCPAHDDRTASLSIGRGDDGRWLLHCHAGCELEAILERVRLSKGDLFPEKTSTGKAAIVAEYRYPDEAGVHLYDVVRFVPKTFRPRRPDGAWTLQGVRRVLYRLNELQGQTTVHVVEGEKDADRLWSIGLPATTNVGGAGKWTDAYTQQLKASSVEQVVILPDNDDPGRAHAEAVARSCHAAGLTVKLVALPDLPVKGDVSDWIAAGHTTAALLAIVQGTPEMDSVSGFPYRGRVATRNESGDGLPFKTAADIATMAPERVDWVVPGFVGPGIVLEVDGKLKASGKTTFLGQMVAGIVRGASFLGQPTKGGPVVWMTEERPQTFLQTLKRARLDDRTDVKVLHWHDVKHLSWPTVMGMTADYAIGIGASTVIVDTIGQWAGLRGDSENSNGDQMTAAEPLQDAAAKGLAIVVARHERKGGGEVGESGRGGSAFSGAVDIVVSIRRGEGKTKPTVRILQTLSRFSETPESLVIELTDNGYIVLGDSATVATLDAERALLDRLPTREANAMDLESVRMIEPVIAKTSTKTAIANLLQTEKVGRVGTGKKGDAYRYFLTIEKVVATQTYRSDQQPETSGGAVVAGRFGL